MSDSLHAVNVKVAPLKHVGLLQLRRYGCLWNHHVLSKHLSTNCLTPGNCTARSTMSSPFTNVLFRYSVFDGASITSFEHSHPVPDFLCQLDPGHLQSSPQFFAAFVDAISVVNSQHHDECMRTITTTYAGGCGKPARDAIKSPTPLLQMVEPTIAIQVIPICSDRPCEAKARAEALTGQHEALQELQENEQKAFLKMKCETCGKADANRCVGCGQVAYCGKECQKQGWKAHKRECRRGNLDKPLPELNLPYEII